VGVVRGLVGMGWVRGWMGVGVGRRMKDWMRIGLERLSQSGFENFLLVEGEGKGPVRPFLSWEGSWKTPG
jgi:hypothetical protein